MWEGNTHKQKLFVRLQKEINRFVRKPMTPHSPQRCSLGFVSEHLAIKIITTIGVNVLDFEYQLDRYAIKHVVNKHATKPELLLFIPLILHEPDTVRRSETTKQNLGSIIFEKQIDQKFYYCVMEIRPSKKILALKTFYKKRKTPC